MFVRVLLVMCFVLASCGDDGGTTTIDAKVVDAQLATVRSVTCPATPAATVISVNASNTYMPMATTINQGQVVKFTMSSFHDVNPQPANSDPGLRVGLGQEACLMFTSTGTFGFFCNPHGFAGTVTVN